MTRDRYKVKLAGAAKADIEAIVVWIARESPARARAAAKRLHRRISVLKTLPLRGRQVPELLASGFTEYRELIEEPWRVIYRVTEREVFVVAVFDSRRLIEDVLLHRLLRG